jgi:hypothetical protein
MGVCAYPYHPLQVSDLKCYTMLTYTTTVVSTRYRRSSPVLFVVVRPGVARWAGTIDGPARCRDCAARMDGGACTCAIPSAVTYPSPPRPLSAASSPSCRHPSGLFLGLPPPTSSPAPPSSP